jgi:hypothetical protein
MSMLLWLLLAQDVDVLIERLGSPRYAERRDALEELVWRGRAARPALEAAARNEDPEIAARAREALDRLGAGGLFDGRGGRDPATSAALDWLGRHQDVDGSWPGTFTCCPGKGPTAPDAGPTGLAALAFLAAGRKPSTCEPLRKALERLASWQGPDGGVGPRGPKFLYDHALGALALAEGYGYGGMEALKGPAQKAADFTAAARNPGRGWRYAPRSGESDSSVTVWATLSLSVGRRVGLRIPDEALSGGHDWLDDMTDAAYGRVGYLTRYTKCGIRSLEEPEFGPHETLSGGAMFTRRLRGLPATAPSLRAARDMLLRDLPSPRARDVDYCYWHLASLGLFHSEDGKGWARWAPALRTALEARRPTSGCAAGSWEPADAWSEEGGRVYATAINALTLRTEQRYRLR